MAEERLKQLQREIENAEQQILRASAELRQLEEAISQKRVRVCISCGVDLVQFLDGEWRLGLESEHVTFLNWTICYFFITNITCIIIYTLNQKMKTIHKLYSLQCS